MRTDKYAVFSVIGPHVGSSIESILKDKMDDIDRIGKTFWLQCSLAAPPPVVQQLCKMGPNIFCFFLVSVGIPRDTKIKKYAISYSTNYKDWQVMPEGMSPVSGRVGSLAQALVMDRIDICEDQVDIGKYIMPRIGLGCSTVCGFRDENLYTSKVRQIMAVGNLCDPYCVYLK